MTPNVRPLSRSKGKISLTKRKGITGHPSLRPWKGVDLIGRVPSTDEAFVWAEDKKKATRVCRTLSGDLFPLIFYWLAERLADRA